MSSANDKLAGILINYATMRTEMLRRLTDPKRDIDAECGYPDKIDINLYRTYFEREGIAARVVEVYPKESWKMVPEIYEVEDENETEFEKAWIELDKQHRIVHFMKRADIMSGIGSYGVILIGINDGQDLSKPAKGIDRYGKPTGDQKAEIIYLRVLDESLITIDSYEADVRNPRYGHPLFYNILLADPRIETGTSGQPGVDTKKVHWSRIIHVADNRLSSEILGQPRMKPVFNYLYNVKKITGGSGEMFWKGGFPGWSFEAHPDAEILAEDEEKLRQQFEDWGHGLQRVLALTGGQLKSLQPQIADPAPHLANQLNAICITLGVPLRVFMGSEQGKLAADQDSRAWNDRLRERQIDYITPCIIWPVIERFQALGILPPAPRPVVDWPDLNTSSDNEKADCQLKRTQALAAYLVGGVDRLVPPKQYLTLYDKLTEGETAMVEAAAEVYRPKADAAADERAAVEGEIAAETAGKTAEAVAKSAPKPVAPKKTP